MEIKDQLTDSGAVIGYRPDLKYEKINEPEKSDTSVINKYINDNSSYTNTIQSYLNNNILFHISFGFYYVYINYQVYF